MFFSLGKDGEVWTKKAADAVDGCIKTEGIKTQGKLYKDPREQDRASYRSGEATERLEEHQSRRRQMIKHIIHIWDTNTCVSPDKQQTPQQSHILILPFCISQCRHSLSPDPWGRLKLFLLFLHLEAAPYERLSLWLLSGRRGEEKRRREEDQGGERWWGGISEHGRNQLRAQQCRDEQSGAGNVGGWRWGGQSQTVLTDVFHSDSLIHCWWEQQWSTIRFSSIYPFCDVLVQMTWWRISQLLIRGSYY